MTEEESLEDERPLALLPSNEPSYFKPIYKLIEKVTKDTEQQPFTLEISILKQISKLF